MFKYHQKWFKTYCTRRREVKSITSRQLKKARHVKDMTQEEVCKILGIHRSYLSQIENGKVIPSDKLQSKIDDYFGNTINDFLFID